MELDTAPIAAEPAPALAAVVIPLPLVSRGGRGSLVTAAALTLFEFVVGEG